jgi:hypothetical protein
MSSVWLKTIPCAFSAMLLCSTIAIAQSEIAATTLTLNGSAKLGTGLLGGPVIWLTPAQQYQAGTAFTTKKIAFGARYIFGTFFMFQMINPNSQASDGMTFVIQTESASALGGDGGALGYVGITPSVAVEFDTWNNGGGFDINDNHAAILTNGQRNDIDPQTPYGVTNCQPTTGQFGCMNNGHIWSVWIDYDGTNLNVAIADNSIKRPANLISYPIDIPALLGPNGAFVGFGAGTGFGYEDHFVFGWRFLLG